MLTIKNYVRAQSLEEAYELNQKKSNCIMGGMMWLRMTSRTVQTMVDLCDLGLNKIEETADEFSLGAMVTLRQLETHEGLNAYTNGCVAKAVQDIVGVQFRNGATLGGSIFGRFGFSDVMTIFLAMDAYVEMFKGGIIPLSEFVKKPYDRDVLVTVSEEKLISIFEGKLDFVDAFNAGELQAEGNLIKALALKEVLEKNVGTKKSLIKKAKGVVATAKAAKKAATGKK